MKRSALWLALRFWLTGIGLCVAPMMLAQTPNGKGTVEAEPMMTAKATPGFDFATIRLSDPNATGGWSFPSEGHHVSCANATVADILSIAYGIQTRQIVDGPAWLSKDRYDISGTPDVPGVPNFVQVRGMYQKLLAERFNLVSHREMRELPIYALTVAKGGPRLKVADANEAMNTGNSGTGSQRTLKFVNMSMRDFALNLNFYEDRPVIDQTALPGRYDFTLRWTYVLTMESETDAPPSLFTAIKEQLGLRMDAVKGPAEVLVIDHVERPSAN